MIEYYVQLKWLHIAAVAMSGSLFMLRGLAVQNNAAWAMAKPLRYLSYTIDTVLLAAALLLLSILPVAVYGNGWLVVKVVLLLVYIALGSFALKRGRSRRVRLACYTGALVVFSVMIVVARTHHPLGPLLPLLD